MPDTEELWAGSVTLGGAAGKLVFGTCATLFINTSDVARQYVFAWSPCASRLAWAVALNASYSANVLAVTGDGQGSAHVLAGASTNDPSDPFGLTLLAGINGAATWQLNFTALHLGGIYMGQTRVLSQSSDGTALDLLFAPGFALTRVQVASNGSADVLWNKGLALVAYDLAVPPQQVKVAFFASGYNVAALDLASGHTVWSTTWTAPNPHALVLVDAGVGVVDGSNVIALNATDGSKMWSTACTPGHLGQATSRTLRGGLPLAVQAGNNLCGLDASSGRLVWGTTLPGPVEGTLPWLVLPNGDLVVTTQKVTARVSGADGHILWQAAQVVKADYVNSYAFVVWLP